MYAIENRIWAAEKNWKNQFILTDKKFFENYNGLFIGLTEVLILIGFSHIT